MAEHSHSSHGLDDEAREEVRRRFETSRLAWSEPSQDASVELRIDADAMAVYADFSPAAPGRSVLKMDDVSRALSDSEVVNGVDWDTIAIATEKCNLDGVELTMVRIATGSKPVHGMPEHLLPEQEVLPGPTYPQPRADGSVDFREISPFRIVTAGQRIGTFVPAREGVEGMDVYGRPIPCVDEQIEHYLAGENTVRSGDELQATLDGRVELEGKTISVNPVLTVDGDVDYHTGHIDFPGDVYVSGQVHDGFKVHAEGSIYAGSPLDATDMVAGGDLTAGHGLMGHNNGTIRIGGTLRAKYLENCLVEAGSDVFVERGILRSHVYTSGMVATSERGMILGGLIFAQNGVQTRQVGTATGPPVAIHCGVDYLAEQKLDILRAKAERITLKLHEVRRMHAHSTSPDLERMLEELKADLRATNEASETLLFDLDRNEQVQVTASGTVFPGTFIEICHVSYTVERDLHAVVFRLDKDSGHITIDKLDRS